MGKLRTKAKSRHQFKIATDQRGRKLSSFGFEVDGKDVEVWAPTEREAVLKLHKRYPNISKGYDKHGNKMKGEEAKRVREGSHSKD